METLEISLSNFITVKICKIISGEDKIKKIETEINKNIFLDKQEHLSDEYINNFVSQLKNKIKET
jgi:hypothetical protein